MSSGRADQRAVKYFLTGWTLSLGAIVIFAGSIPHGLYAWSLIWPSGMASHLRGGLALINERVMAMPVLGWIWSNLPSPTDDLVSGLLLSPLICTAVAFAIIGVYLRKVSKSLRGDDHYRHQAYGHHQSVGVVYANGNVKINQVVNEQSSSQPLNVAIRSAFITIVVNLIGALIRYFLE